MTDTAAPEFEIQHALFTALGANPFGGFYAITVLANFAPWRSAMVGVCGTLAVGLLWHEGMGPLPFLLVVFSSALLFGVELLNRRTAVKAGRIILQSGLWTLRREAYPLREVRSVDYSYPALGGPRLLDIGDLEVLGTGWALSLAAVSAPAQTAQRILDAKAQAEDAESKAQEGAA